MGERAEWEEHENRWNAAGSDYENFPYRSAQWTQWRAVEPNPPYMRRPDQIMLHDLLLGDVHNAYVDHKARLWQCMQVTRPYANANFRFDTTAGQWQNTDTGAYPAYFHYNGPCKYVLADTAASLNLVRNRIMRAHLARRGAWDTRHQLAWLRALQRKMQSGKTGDGGGAESGQHCLAALQAHASSLARNEYRLDAAAEQHIYAACADAVRTRVSRSEFGEFVRVFDRSLQRVSEATLDSIFEQCDFV